MELLDFRQALLKPREFMSKFQSHGILKLFPVACSFMPFYNNRNGLYPTPPSVLFVKM